MSEAPGEPGRILTADGMLRKLRGGRTNDFWQYNIAQNSWKILPRPARRARDHCYQLGLPGLSPFLRAVSRPLSSFAIFPAAEFPSIAVTFPESSTTEVLESTTV
jgi:hypothetical protein